MLPRNVERFGRPVREVASLDEFLGTGVVEGVTTVDYSSSPLDLLIEDRGSAVTVVVFHAALSRAVSSLPVFSGLGMLKAVEANVICVADPTISRYELPLAWYGGSRDQPLQRDLPRVLDHVLTHFGDESRPLFFGASGGGFAALYYGSRFPGSAVVAVNPQTDLAMYTPGPVVDYTRAAFGVDTLDIPVVTNLVAHYAAERRDVSIAYVQNRQDVPHRDRHLGPFMRANARGISLFAGAWGRGHKPPPVEFLRGLVTSVVESGGDWAPAMAAAGGISSPTARDVTRLLRGVARDVE